MRSFSVTEREKSLKPSRMTLLIVESFFISDYTADEICFFADCINVLPRKILGYCTPEELFDRHLDRIYTA